MCVKELHPSFPDGFIRCYSFLSETSDFFLFSLSAHERANRIVYTLQDKLRLLK